MTRPPENLPRGAQHFALRLQGFITFVRPPESMDMAEKLQPGESPIECSRDAYSESPVSGMDAAY